MDIRTILIPVDFSEYSEKALVWAINMAETWRSRLILLHVIPTPNYPPLVLSGYFDVATLEAGLREDAELKVKELVESRGAKTVQLDTRVVIGEPFHDVCQVAEEEKADLIVMGSHGRTGFHHVLLGSVAERVVHHAPCPVLVVGKTAPA
jgi:universal stress protein A